MKILIALTLFSTLAYSAPQKGNKILPVTDVDTTVKNNKMKSAQTKTSKPAAKKEEDCDDKAKKPVVIEPESISLGGGTAGCKLPE